MKDKLTLLKQNHNIMDVAVDILGLDCNQSEDKATAVSCWNDAIHTYGDRHPSLLLMPNVNRWECKGCGEKGDVVDLIQKYKHISFKEAVSLLEPIPAAEETPEEYLQKRDITEETMQKFHIIVSENSLGIPFPDGRIKYRNFNTSPRYKNPHGQSIVYKTKDASTKNIVLTEGEIDAIKLHQETGGAVWSSSSGAASLPSHVLPEFLALEKIYICYDNDTAGQTGAIKTAAQLGTARCYKVALPSDCKDVTDFFIKGNTKKDFLILIKNAICFEDIVTEEDVIDYSKLSDEEILTVGYSEEKLSLGIPSVKMTFPPGFYLIAAAQGVGKSWFALFLIQQWYLLHQKTSVFFSLEMTEKGLRKRALQQWSHLTQSQFEGTGDKQPAIDLLQKNIMRVSEFGMQDESLRTPEYLEEQVRKFYQKGCRVFVFDHLHQLKGMSDGSTAAKVSDVWSAKIQQLTHEFSDIWFICFAQPTKLGGKGIIRKEDIRFASSFVDKADVILSLNRKMKKDAQVWGETMSVDEDDRDVLLYLAKNRLLDVTLTGWKLYFSSTGNFLEDALSEIVTTTIIKNNPIASEGEIVVKEQDNLFSIITTKLSKKKRKQTQELWDCLPKETQQKQIAAWKQAQLPEFYRKTSNKNKNYISSLVTEQEDNSLDCLNCGSSALYPAVQKIGSFSSSSNTMICSICHPKNAPIPDAATWLLSQNKKNYPAIASLKEIIRPESLWTTEQPLCSCNETQWYEWSSMARCNACCFIKKDSINLLKEYYKNKKPYALLVKGG